MTSKTRRGFTARTTAPGLLLVLAGSLLLRGATTWGTASPTVRDLRSASSASPAEGNVVSVLPTGGAALGVTVADALLPLHGQGVDAVDQMGGPALAVALAGDFLFAGVGPRLVILDVSRGDHATVVGRSAVLSGAVTAVAVGDGYAYVAVGSLDAWYYRNVPDLYAIDVRDPTRPRVVGRLGDAAAERGYETWSRLAVWEDHVYVVPELPGVRVIDVGDGTAPREVAQIRVDGPFVELRDVGVDRGYAYITTDTALHVVDVRQPAAPREVTALAVGADEWTSFGVMWIDGGMVYVATTYAEAWGQPSWGAALGILDVRDPASPRPVSLTRLGTAQSTNARDIHVAGGLAFMAGYRNELDLGSGVLALVDVSDPSAPVFVGFAGQASAVDGVRAAHDRAYTVGRLFGVSVLDLSVLARSPRQLGALVATHPVGGPCGMASRGGIVYLSTDDDGLQVVDAGDPTAPRLVADRVAPVCGRIVPDGQHVYVADRYAGLIVFDVSVPTKPREVARLAEQGGLVDVAVLANRAFAVTTGAALPCSTSVARLRPASWKRSPSGVTLSISTSWTGTRMC